MEGKHVEPSPASALTVKDIKPEGMDFVQGALDAVGVKGNLPSMAAMGISDAHVCVPPDAPAGKVTVNVSNEVRGALSVLNPVTLPVVVPEAAPKSEFTTGSLSEWSMKYYRNPEPALLPAVIPFIFSNDAAANILQQFVITAMQGSPAVVERFGCGTGVR